MLNVLYSLNKFGAISQYFKEQFSKTNYILCYKQQIETTELNMGACRTQADVVIYTMAKSACALLNKPANFYSKGHLMASCKVVSNLNVSIDFVNLMCLLPFGISLQNGIYYH